jgi:hypothetical protein
MTPSPVDTFGVVKVEISTVRVLPEEFCSLIALNQSAGRVETLPSDLARLKAALLKLFNEVISSFVAEFVLVLRYVG